MTRRVLLTSAGRRLALIAKVMGAVLLAYFVVVGLRDSHLVLGGIAVLLALLLLALGSVAASIIAGAAAGAIFGARPRLAGALAGVLALAAVEATGLMESVDVARQPLSSRIVGTVVSVAWWGYWGSVGGAFAAQVRAGWREPRRDRSVPPTGNG